MEQKIIEKLLNAGYENVTAQKVGSATIVTFENVVFRSSVRGLQTAFARSLLNLSPTNPQLCLVPIRYGIPMASLETHEIEVVRSKKHHRQIFLPHLQVGDPEQTVHFLDKTAFSNPSKTKSDLIIHPDFHAVLGNYDDPVAMQINLLPELRIAVFDGGVASFSLIVPLYNELESFANVPRLGPTQITVIRRFPFMTWFYFSAGYFYGDQYGVQGLVRHYFGRGKFALDGRIGYSGYAVMDHGQFLYEPLNALTGSLSLTYFWRPSRLFLCLGFHRFLKGDQGWRFDTFRYFGDLRLGFWAHSIEGEWNGGVRVAVPLPPSRYRSRNVFRMRPAERFSLAYQGKRETWRGELLQMSEVMEELLIDYFPAYLQSTVDLSAGKQ
ncbi:MAG: YjbH domain-containing protein [candidate division KSB1 bacterium]|nr:YjbH domain-containing protein [candidate division KSB1 bacterium]